MDGSYQVEVGERYRWGRLTTTGLAVACGSQVSQSVGQTVREASSQSVSE